MIFMKIRQPLRANWEFRQANVKTKEWLPARVPGCVHTDLRRNKRIPDPFWGANELDLQWIEDKNWRYRAKFGVDPELLHEDHIDLVTEGLDTLATVVLNDTEIARTENMFAGWRIPVKKLLRKNANTIEITFASASPYIRSRMPTWFEPKLPKPPGRAIIRKEQRQFGWDWGPRFVTCGIWKPIRLEAWSENRIESVCISQTHVKKKVTLRILPETAKKNSGMKFRCRLSLKGETIAEVAGLELAVKNPRLWWPNGLGAQPLYDLEIELLGTDGVTIDKITRRIGLRTIELDRHADRWGESFQFKVNGLPIFAKGANWIPAHTFATEVNRALYDDLLSSAAEANMNMIRVWGGGIYEMEDFYDLCDEKGLLVWQDFMFACAHYPGNKHYISLVRQEAMHQVKRLAHRACLALWCGNNESELFPGELLETRRRRKAYEDVFYKVLPEVVAKYDGVTVYWPSSPHNPEGWEKGFNNECAGDCHFWDVWHQRFPVKRYEEMKFRFCSEFGMQSYSSPEVAETYCRRENFNVFGPEMENHQKNSGGNLIILDYISRLYRFPKDYAALAYLSQLNQAYCMKVGVEHFRRSSPRTMGALYWQLNDCWPVASWSSLEFGGRWKALHYEAKRFFAPALISVHVPGTETVGVNNSLQSTIHDVAIYTVFDGPNDRAATVIWSLNHLENGVVRAGKKKVVLRYGESVRQLPLDFADEIGKHGACALYLRVELVMGAKVVSRQTIFFTAPRYIDLKPGKTMTRLEKLGTARFELTLSSKVYQHAVVIHFKGIHYRVDDNFFDLFPGSPRRVEIRAEKDLPLREFAKRLETTSLVSSYR